MHEYWQDVMECIVLGDGFVVEGLDEFGDIGVIWNDQSPL